LTNEAIQKLLYRHFRSAMWKRVRRAMMEIVLRRSTEVYGDTYVMLGMQVEGI
jgi:hypothetical protein